MTDEKIKDMFIQGNPVNEGGPTYPTPTEEEMTEENQVPATDEEQAEIEKALGPRRSAQMDLRTDEEKRKAQRLFELINKRNPVPQEQRGNIKLKAKVKRKLQKAARKKNR